MKLFIIAAIAQNRVIGKGGRLPWHVSEDLKRFKQLTTGHTILMGRKTYDSIGRSLPGRRNVVLTSTQIEGVECYATVEEALTAVRSDERVFVIGGGEVYKQLMDKADAFHLTLLDEEMDGDTYFPPYEDLLRTLYKETHREVHDGFKFVDYERVA